MRKFGTAAIIASATLILAGCTGEKEETAAAEPTEAEMPAEENVPAAETTEAAGEDAGEDAVTTEEEADDGERTGPDDRIVQ